MTRRTATNTKRTSSRPPRRHVYPFAAIVGQGELKLALLLNVIAPAIGGVLVMGHRGTGKSTAVRALAELLPLLSKVRGCLYGCDPQGEENLCADCRARLAEAGVLPRERAPVAVVELPLNATEDRVVGAINLERAIREGVKTFEPGLLARAHRGFLYIDEVNLLEDHLVDLLLDVAASGRNRVEREGVSIEHPSEFVLAGSGNPEEGELRPQLLDRFGLYTEIRTSTDLEERIEIITRREAFDQDPAAFCAVWEREQASLRRRLVRAREAFKILRLRPELVRGIAELCGRLGVDGHRGELTIARAARALCAFENRKEVAPEDVRRVAALALGHRLRRDPLEPSGGGGSQIEQAARELFGAGDTSAPDKNDASEAAGGRAEAASDAAEPAASKKRRGRPKKTSTEEPCGNDEGAGDESRESRSADADAAPQARTEPRPAPTLDVRLPPAPDEKPGVKTPHAKPVSHARSRTHATRAASVQVRGRYTRAVARREHDPNDLKLALDATLRVAAAAQFERRPQAGAANGAAVKASGAIVKASGAAVATGRTIEVGTADLRYKHFSRRTGTLFIFAVDTSGSMALNRIRQAKGALVRLLRESYVKRDRVALIAFRERAARVLLQPSQSSARARRLLDAMPVGGATPLTSGLLRALEMSERAVRRGGERIVLLVFTDGRANVARDGRLDADRALVQRQIKNEVELVGVALQRIGVASVVVDTQNRFTRGGEGEALARALGGRYVYLPTSAEIADALAEN
jgi:magnesium chelatase subunit D